VLEVLFHRRRGDADDAHPYWRAFLPQQLPMFIQAGRQHINGGGIPG
jgi:hypothetical protein